MQWYSGNIPELRIKSITWIRSKSNSMMTAKTPSYVTAKQSIQDPRTYCFLLLLICACYSHFLSLENHLLLLMNHLLFCPYALVLLTQRTILQPMHHVNISLTADATGNSNNFFACFFHLLEGRACILLMSVFPKSL